MMVVFAYCDLFFSNVLLLLLLSQQFPDPSRSNPTEDGRQGATMNDMGSGGNADYKADSFTRLKNIPTPLEIRNKLS